MKQFVLCTVSFIFYILVTTVIGSSETPPSTLNGVDDTGIKTIEEVIKDAREGVEFMGNEDLQRRIDANPKLVLIDVRTKQEYDAGHLKGATCIERGVLEFTLARTLRDPDAEIVVYCGKGNRSALTAKALLRMGFTNVKSHIGFESWVKAGLPFHNFLGEARMIKLSDINSATNPVDFYQNKK